MKIWTYASIESLGSFCTRCEVVPPACVYAYVYGLNQKSHRIHACCDASHAKKEIAHTFNYFLEMWITQKTQFLK